MARGTVGRSRVAVSAPQGVVYLVTALLVAEVLLAVRTLLAEGVSLLLADNALNRAANTITTDAGLAIFLCRLAEDAPSTGSLVGAAVVVPTLGAGLGGSQRATLVGALVALGLSAHVVGEGLLLSVLNLQETILLRH